VKNATRKKKNAKKKRTPKTMKNETKTDERM
jgi:hypothetical protein